MKDEVVAKLAAAAEAQLCLVSAEVTLPLRRVEVEAFATFFGVEIAASAVREPCVRRSHAQAHLQW